MTLSPVRASVFSSWPMLVLAGIGAIAALAIAGQVHRLDFGADVCIFWLSDVSTCGGHPIDYWLRTFVTMPAALAIGWLALVAHVRLRIRRGNGADVTHLLPMPLTGAAIFLAGTSWWTAASLSSRLVPPPVVPMTLGGAALAGLALTPRLVRWLSHDSARLDRLAIGTIGAYLVALIAFCIGGLASLAAAAALPTLEYFPEAQVIRAAAGWPALSLVAIGGAVATGTVITRRGMGAARTVVGILLLTIIAGATTGFLATDRGESPPGSPDRPTDLASAGRGLSGADHA